MKYHAVSCKREEGNPKAEMTSEVWCKIWDDFFVPSERVLSFDEKRQKAIIEPRFCKEEPLTVESLEILWGALAAGAFIIEHVMLYYITLYSIESGSPWGQ